MESLNPESSELHDFVEFLFGGLNGTAYVAVVNPQDRTDWDLNFFSYPADASRMEKVILDTAAQRDVYLAPVLYKSPGNVDKENVKCSNVVWTEFDGNAPNEDDYFTKPSYRVQSSDETRQHVYWRLSEPLYDVNNLEKINKAITFNLAADSSAWDATQVLRPPDTINHKPERNGAKVKVVAGNSIAYDSTIFDQLPDAPESVDTSNWQLGTLPDPASVVLKYAFSPDMVLLFNKSADDLKDRSTALMNLAYGCAEMGMSDAEIFVVLLNADDRWGKFKDRKDRNKRLAHIITIARHKHPDSDESVGDPYAFAFDFVTFLQTDIEIDWVVEPMLMEQGSMLMVGPSGIGKTQISLRFMIALALGKDFLHYTITKPRKILFMSLEMGHGELKKFVETMAKTLGPDDFTLLQENLVIIPHGEKWPLNTPVGQEHLVRMLENYGPDGVFIDSIGSAIQGSINDDEAVQGYLDFIDRARKKYGCFFWAIHHMRKSTNGGHAPASQDDVYGNQYLVNRSTSTYGILRGRDGLIKVRNFKLRLAEKEQDYLIRRIDNLDFEKSNVVVDEKIESVTYKAPEASKGPEKVGNFNI